jgi:PAS domain S-box-containing protein
VGYRATDPTKLDTAREDVIREHSVVSGSARLTFVLAILVLIFGGIASYRSEVASNESIRWVRHSHEVLERLQSLLSDMTGVESSTRGFALTGKESELAFYRADISSALRDEEALRRLTADNVVQQREFPGLETLIAQKTRVADAVILLRRNEGLEAAAEAADVDSDQLSMSGVQDIIRRLEDEDSRLLAERNSDAKTRLDRNKRILIAGTGGGLLMAIAVGWSVQRDSAGRELTRALWDSQEKYRTLLDGQNYAIVMMDTQGNVLSWNAGAERIEGYTAEEIIGQNFSCLFTASDIKRGRPQEILGLTAASGRHEEEAKRVRKDGTRFLASLTFTALRDPAGNLWGFSESSYDLSNSTESEAKYRGLLEAAPDAMVIADEQGLIVLVNAQTESLFGYHRDELVGQPVEMLVPQSFRAAHPQQRQGYTANPHKRIIDRGGELRGLRRDGSEFPAEIGLSPLETAEGILVTAAIRDISLRKKSEEQLMKTMDELKRSNDDLQQFAYVASHDLQEPLRMVASYTQLIASRYQGKLDADADEFIAFAIDGCNRMQVLIQDLLAYSRAGTDGKALSEVSSEETLLAALANLGLTLEKSGAIVTHDLLPTIMTDETQLRQVLQNLIGNAIKYRGAEAPQVHVSAKNDAKKWIFSVRDNGLGIDPKNFERIFILFQRLHGRNEFEGTGIGLAICKKILERLGGRIWVESQLGRGSTFFFALPEIQVK